jgi:phosphoribosylamine--glycine ligase
VRAQAGPLVIKAEGLAAGKGVFVCATRAQAEAAIRETMVARAFGSAGDRVLVEQFLEGEEASILALVDGRTVVMLASAQDHKRIFDDDQGPNTGGMGAYSPAPVITPDLWPVIREQVFDRTLAELRRRGIVYKGVLYAGVMMTRTGPKVLEFNCRFGDPETQAVLPRMECDFVGVLEACIDGTLREDMIRWRPDPCVCIVMAAGGYPGAYAKGKAIEGLGEAGRLRDVVVFHAGTKRVDGKTVTAGGRVLGVTACGRDLKTAVAQGYRAVSAIAFEGAQYRKDIAARALAREGAGCEEG